MDSIPPWLNVGPTSFGNAAAEGAHLDLARQQADVESAMNATKLQIQKQQQDREFAMQEQQEAFNREMKQTQIGMQAQQVARKFQAQQQYQQLVQGGMEPAQAMLRVGPTLGINMVGAGQLARWSQPPPPPQSIDFGNGNGGVYYNHRYFPNKAAAKEFTDETINGHLMQRDSTGKLYPVLHASDAEGVLNPQQKVRATFLAAQIKALASDPLAGRNPATQLKLKGYQDEFDRLTGAQPQEGDEAPPASPAGAAPAQAPIQMVWNPATKRYMMPRQ